MGRRRRVLRLGPREVPALIRPRARVLPDDGQRLDGRHQAAAAEALEALQGHRVRQGIGRVFRFRRRHEGGARGDHRSRRIGSEFLFMLVWAISLTSCFFTG